jgi:hypothetical protein
MGEHFRRPINAMGRAGWANALGGFNQQCPCAAANIQNSLAWLEVRQVEGATPESLLTTERVIIRASQS